MSLLKTQIEAVRANAAAIVANCDVVLASLASIEQVPSPSKTQPCPHPKANRVDTSTMGAASYRCLACGTDVEESQE